MPLEPGIVYPLGRPAAPTDYLTPERRKELEDCPYDEVAVQLLANDEIARLEDTIRGFLWLMLEVGLLTESFEYMSKASQEEFDRFSEFLSRAYEQVTNEARGQA